MALQASGRATRGPVEGLMRWARGALAISPLETSFERRGFSQASAVAVAHLERVGRAFVDGFNAAMLEPDLLILEGRLQFVEPEFSGFAFEGSAMALAILDHLPLQRGGRWESFLKGPAVRHDYMVHVGAGWALARLRRDPSQWISRIDSAHRWLVVDGYGFHQAYFNWPTYARHAKPSGLRGYAAHAFDQGVGRALWFVGGAEPQTIAGLLHGFTAARRADLWSGVGLAATYAGGCNLDSLESLRGGAGEHAGHFAQGAAFAAKARVRAGNLTAWTDAASRLITGRSALEAAAVTDQALAGAGDPINDLCYETWRAGVRVLLGCGS